jgi:hypothetical protein
MSEALEAVFKELQDTGEPDVVARTHRNANCCGESGSLAGSRASQIGLANPAGAAPTPFRRTRDRGAAPAVSTGPLRTGVRLTLRAARVCPASLAPRLAFWRRFRLFAVFVSVFPVGSDVDPSSPRRVVSRRADGRDGPSPRALPATIRTPAAALAPFDRGVTRQEPNEFGGRGSVVERLERGFEKAALYFLCCLWPLAILP